MNCIAIENGGVEIIDINVIIFWHLHENSNLFTQSSTLFFADLSFTTVGAVANDSSFLPIFKTPMSFHVLNGPLDGIELNPGFDAVNKGINDKILSEFFKMMVEFI